MSPLLRKLPETCTPGAFLRVAGGTVLSAGTLLQLPWDHGMSGIPRSLFRLDGHLSISLAWPIQQFDLETHRVGLKTHFQTGSSGVVYLYGTTCAVLPLAFQLCFLTRAELPLGGQAFKCRAGH